MERIKNFLRSVRQEVDKVSWPSRNLAIKATVSVIIFALVVGFTFGS